MSNVRSAQTDKVRFFGNTTPQELAAQYGTPLYVYNEDVLRRRCPGTAQPFQPSRDSM